MPDVAGAYQLTLNVSDFLGLGTPDTVLVTAVSAQDFATGLIVAASEIIIDLAVTQVTTQGNRQAFLNFLNQAVVAIQAGNSADAIQKLQNSIARTDGCPIRGSADGNGAGRDWITDCNAQFEIYDLLNQALDALTP